MVELCEGMPAAQPHKGYWMLKAFLHKIGVALSNYLMQEVESDLLTTPTRHRRAEGVPEAGRCPFD